MSDAYWKNTAPGEEVPILKTPDAKHTPGPWSIYNDNGVSVAGTKAGVKCECGSTNTVWISGGGYQDADASRGLPMIETDGQIACNDCGRTWWD
jgi:hypothetical protein